MIGVDLITKTNVEEVDAALENGSIGLLVHVLAKQAQSKGNRRLLLQSARAKLRAHQEKGKNADPSR